jgi:RNA polymerase sigma factor (sigma-70 family)
MGADSKTRATLLERLRDGADPLAWDQFFARYWRLIYTCARGRGCREHTAEEVVQEVMLAVFEQRHVFRYDPARGRFRDWLAAVVRNTVAGHRRQPAERLRALEGSQQDYADPPADDAPPDALWEAAFEQAMLAVLLDVVRREVAPETFQAFELLALGQVPGDQVAAVTGLSRNAVYLARKRVVNRLQELGADYREHGRLDERIRQALEMSPDAPVVRSVTSRTERTMRSRWSP